LYFTESVTCPGTLMCKVRNISKQSAVVFISCSIHKNNKKAAHI
jgi:hypothetical protein